jgi:hypothetical protein
MVDGHAGCGDVGRGGLPPVFHFGAGGGTVRGQSRWSSDGMTCCETGAGGIASRTLHRVIGAKLCASKEV